MKRFLSIAALSAAFLSAHASAATWNPFIIRTGAQATPLFITDVAGVVTTQIDEGSEKTGEKSDKEATP